MLKKILTVALAAGMVWAFSWQTFAAEEPASVHAQAVPLDESAGGAEVTPAGASDEAGASGGQDMASKKAPAEAGTADSGMHVVIKGDTLWDLSGRYLANPFMWTEVWKVNPQIENPNLIYPGEEVVLPGVPRRTVIAGRPVVGVPAAGEAETPREEARSMYDQAFGKEEPFVDRGKTIMRLDQEEESKVISLDVEKKEKIPVTTLAEVLNAGYLLKDPKDYRWTYPHETKRLYYSLGDEILVWPVPDLHIGDYLITAKDEGEVEHPEEFFSDLGDMIQPTGMVQITGRGGDFYTAEVVMALEEIQNEDMLMKFKTPPVVYEPVPRNPRLRGKWGYVVSSKWRKILNEQSQYLYLDLGSDDGVKVGDVFQVWREEPVVYEFKYYTDDEGTRRRKTMAYKRPETYIGKVQVISVHDGTSTARATVTDEPIEVGYRAYYED